MRGEVLCRPLDVVWLACSAYGSPKRNQLLWATVKACEVMKLIRTTYHSDGNYLECKHCHDLTELYRNTGEDPQKLMEVREGYEERHSTDAGCCSYALESACHELERKEIKFTRQPKSQTPSLKWAGLAGTWGRVIQ